MSRPEAYAAALAGLPFMDWARLRRLLAGSSPQAAWRRVVDGGEGAGIAEAARAVDVSALDAAHTAAGVGVHLLGAPGYPEPLAGDHEAPPVVFTRGSPAALAPRRAGVVGTRRCTHYGRDVARELGKRLAAAGVAVVSGLALGIDGAAHEGALEADATPPIGVVGCGLDVVYPARHGRLWARVAAAGVLVSEAPLGARPDPWRFPARNRLIAALSEVLVVVESHRTGGSMHTVRAADERGVTVLVVPGPVTSAASEGTNELLSEGCGVARDACDVLAALNLRTAAAGRPADPRAAPHGVEAAVLQSVDWVPTSLERIIVRVGLPPAEVTLALSRLRDAGWVRGSGGWWERTGYSE